MKQDDLSELLRFKELKWLTVYLLYVLTNVNVFASSKTT